MTASSTSALSDAHLAALGRVVIAFARLEFAVSGFLWKLIGPNQFNNQVVTARLGFQAKLDLLAALFQNLPVYGVSADLKGLRETLTVAGKAKDVRNDVLHSLVWNPNDQGEMTRANLRAFGTRPFEWQTALASAQELDRAALQIEDAARTVGNFMIDHFAPYGADAWASPYGSGTAWGVNMQDAINWERQFGRGREKGPDR